MTLIDTVKDEVIKTFHVGFGTEPQNGAVTTRRSLLYQPFAVTGRSLTRRRKRSSSTSTPWVSGTTPSWIRTDGLCICSRSRRRRALETAVTRIAEDTAQGSDRRRRKNAQSRRNHSNRSGAAAGHHQPGRQVRLYERRRPDGIPGHRYRRPQSCVEGDLHADAGRTGCPQQISRHRCRERRQRSVVERRRPQFDLRVRRDGSPPKQIARFPSAGSHIGFSRRKIPRRCMSPVRAATS